MEKRILGFSSTPTPSTSQPRKHLWTKRPSPAAWSKKPCLDKGPALHITLTWCSEPFLKLPTISLWLVDFCCFFIWNTWWSNKELNGKYQDRSKIRQSFQAQDIKGERRTSQPLSYTTRYGERSNERYIKIDKEKSPEAKGCQDNIRFLKND